MKDRNNEQEDKELSFTLNFIQMTKDGEYVSLDKEQLGNMRVEVEYVPNYSGGILYYNVA
ncbi:MAG TPA: hypothetical protein PLX41_12345 [Bacteroidales bacterium]|nr:hypothetical protein [Bacteroidales bacterium]